MDNARGFDVSLKKLTPKDYNMSSRSILTKSRNGKKSSLNTGGNNTFESSEVVGTAYE